MSKSTKKYIRRERIKKGIRKRVNGTADRPRLSVFRSNKEIYAQIINDIDGKTIVAASSRSKDISEAANGKSKSQISKEVGMDLARKAKDAGVEVVVFDRNGYRFQGRVAALAEGAREGGLNF